MPIYRQAEARQGRRHLQIWRRRARRSVGLLLLTLTVCTFGLALLDSSGLPFSARLFRALWNAFNLITTLGSFTSFENGQKVFMIGAMCVSMTLVGYALAELTGVLSSQIVIALRENRMMERQLEHLTGHVIVIGYGPLGQIVAKRLRSAGETVVIMERIDDLASQASEDGYLVVDAETGTDDDTLNRSGVDKARALVVTIDDVDRKVSITLMAHTLNPQLNIAVTSHSQQRVALLQRAGATEVIIAEDLVAEALVSRLGTTRIPST